MYNQHLAMKYFLPPRSRVLILLLLVPKTGETMDGLKYFFMMDHHSTKHFMSHWL